jgi:hypothetical protein
MAGGKPIDVVIDTDVDGVVSGAGKVVASFEDIQDAFKEITQASGHTSKDMQDDAKDAAKKIDRDLTQALDNVKDDSKDAGKAVGKHIKDGADKAGEGFDELKDESKSTAKEAAASFGSIEDAADALQEVAANAFSGFGPAGMAAGIVAAAGIGLAISALQDNADKINENKEKILGLAQTIKDNGGVFRESDYIQSMDDYGFAIQDTKEWFEVFQKDAVSGFEQMRDSAEKAGVGIGDVFKGQFGSLGESKAVLGDLEAKLATLESQTKDSGTAVDDFGRSIDLTDPAIRKAIDGNKELSDKVRNHIRDLEAANEIERIRKEAIEGTTQAIKEDIDAVDERAGHLRDAQSSEMDYLDGVDNLTQKLKDNGATLDINSGKGRDNRRAVLDQAAAIKQVADDSIDAGGKIGDVTKKFEAQKNQLINQVMPAFGGSREKAKAYIDTIIQTPKSVSTAVKVTGIAEAEAQVRKFTDVGRHIYVNFETGDTFSVDNYIQGMKAGVTVPVGFAARGKPALAP